jgi:hypothetical protein
MGPVTCHMPHRHRLVKQFDLVQDDIITSHELTDQFQSSDLLRIRSCGGVESNQKSKVNLIVVSPLLNGHRRWPATRLNMAGWWCMMQARYKILEGDRRGPGGPVAHWDPPEVVGDEDCYRNRAQICGFQWASTEGNDGFLTIEDELVQFLWLGYFPRRAESLEPNGRAWDGL